MRVRFVHKFHADKSGQVHSNSYKCSHVLFSSQCWRVLLLQRLLLKNKHGCIHFVSISCVQQL